MTRIEGQKIVTIGGGTGTPVVNEALLLAGVEHISSIVTVMDSGGVTGRMRTDSKGEEIAYSDALRIMLSLIDPDQKDLPHVQSLRRILRQRNARGQDLGYTIFSHFYSQESGFGETQRILEDLTGYQFRGVVLPITTSSTDIVFETKSGQRFKGEHELDDKRMSKDMVKRTWLAPQVAAYPDTLTAIREADWIIFACGSLYGSVLVNLLPEGVKEAYQASQSKRVLVTNLASTRSETHFFQPADFIKVFQEYTGEVKPLDFLIVPKMTRRQFEERHPETARRYGDEHSHFLGWDEAELQTGRRIGVAILQHEATTIDPVHLRLRHDPKKLSEVFRRLLDKT